MGKRNYKEIEAAHYDDKVINRASDNVNGSSSNSSIEDRLIRSAHLHYEQVLGEVLREMGGGEMLDYGCGSGQKHFKFASKNWKLTGIDISEKSIVFARSEAHKRRLNAFYEVMDCENMSFPDENFDIVCDYGTFSSLNIDRAFPDLLRILKPHGTLISIETLGHNPFTNFRRLLNVMSGRRTRWAAGHIMKLKDWQNISRYFNSMEIKYFGFFVLFLFPIFRIFQKNSHLSLLSIFEKMDYKILNNNLLRRLAFKTVVVLRSPTKNLNEKID